MLVRKEDADWVLTPHTERSYDTEVERRFFTAVENPKPTTEEMKEMVRDYGKYLKQDR